LRNREIDIRLVRAALRNPNHPNHEDPIR
jgi:hypothetical protein